MVQKAVIALGLIFVAAFSWPAYKNVNYFLRLREARQHLQENRAFPARDVLEKMAKEWPNDKEVQYRLAVSYRRTGKLLEVEEHLNRATELGWSTEDTNRQIHLLKFQQGFVSEAEPYLHRLLDRGASDEVAEEVYEAMVVGYLSEYHINEAKRCLDYWISWKPNDPDPHYLMAELAALAQMRDMEDQQYQKILEANPNDFRAHASRANMLVSINRVEEAEEEYKICLDLWDSKYSSAPTPMLGMAECAYRQARQEEAREWITKFLEATPEEADSLIALAQALLGQVLIDMQEYEEAVDAFQEAVEKLPNDHLVHNGLGRALSLCGRQEEAAESFARGERIREFRQRYNDNQRDMMNDPSNVEFRVESAYLLLELDDMPGCFHTLIGALRMNRAHPRANAVMAAFFRKKGDEVSAKEYAEFAGTTRPEDTPVLDSPNAMARKGKNAAPPAPGGPSSESPLNTDKILSVPNANGEKSSTEPDSAGSTLKANSQESSNPSP